MKNWAPLIVVIIFIALLASLYGPGLYREYQFKRTINAMLSSARQGKLADVVLHVEKQQRQAVQLVLTTALPADYHQNIKSLRLTSLRKPMPDKFYATVTLKIEQGEVAGIYQGKLLWHYEDGQWEWDFAGSYGAAFSPSGEPQWLDLKDIISTAEH